MFVALIALAQTVTPLDVEGVWYTEGRQSQVEIARDGDSVTGSIIWYVDVEQTPVFDEMNPEEALQDKEILGLKIIQGFEEGRNRWRRGQIYDPTVGKVYRSAIFRIDEDRLGVQGCVGPICRTLEWERVPDNDVTRIDRAPLTRNAPTE